MKYLKKAQEKHIIILIILLLITLIAVAIILVKSKTNLSFWLSKLFG